MAKLGSNGSPSAVSGKMECFEGLRGLASVAVLLGHLVIAFWPILYSIGHPEHTRYPKLAAWISSSTARVIFDGQYAVALFFLLSGFVLSLSFFKNGSYDSLSSAAIRRYFRLVIPASASIILAYLVMKAGWMYNLTTAKFMTESLGFDHQWLGYFYNFTPHFKKAVKECYWDTIFGNTALFNQNLWTMSVEYAGSFLVYAFLALFGTLRRRGICYLVVGTCLILNNRQYMLDFMLGMMLCDLYVGNLSLKRKFFLPLPVAVLLAYASFYINYLKTSGPYKLLWVELENRIIYDTIAGFIMVGVMAFSETIQKLFQRRIFVFLGKISFALYLVHLVMICSVASGCYLYIRQDLGWSHNRAAAAASVACISASFALAWLMYLYVDRPAIAIGRFVYERLFKKAPERGGPARIVSVEAAPALKVAKAA